VPGPYRLEVDLVQEDVAWFSLKGSRAAGHPFTVTPATAAPGPAAGAGAAAGALAPPAVMEMYATPREEVVRFLSAHGAELLKSEDDGAGGGEWLGYLYWVTKPGVPRGTGATPDRELAALARAWEARDASRDQTGDWTKLLEETLTGAGLPKARRRSLVVGCGEGELPAALARWFDESWGVELTPGLVRRAEERQRGVAKCRFRPGLPGRLGDLPDAGFDLVVVPSLLHHVRGIQRSLDDLARLVAPGGVLACSFPEPPTGGGAPPQGTALPDAAFRAEITILQAPEQAPAGGRFTVRARVRNLGDTTWPVPGDGSGRFPVSLANHWLGPRGGLLVSDDARTPLPAPLAPGAEVELTLEPIAPVRPGPFVLELDLVQEGVVWFEERGSRTAKRPLTVVESDAPPAAGLPIRWASLEQCRDAQVRAGFQIFAATPDATALPPGRAIRVFARK
jgi:SAM-dependent methyltransferase